jgi:plastocyanin
LLNTNLRAGRRAPFVIAVAATALVLAACSAASPSEPAGSAAAGGRCSVTLAAPHADATVEISGLQFGDEVTIPAGGVVEFTNQDSVGHVVAEGTDGLAAADACINEPIAAGTSLLVTFTEPGDYQITCTIHRTMHTAIHVE